MDPYILLLTGAGVIVLLTAWLPMVLNNLPLSLPIICVGLGMGIFALSGEGWFPNPLAHPHYAERLTESVVIIALMGAGLKLDRPLGWRSWRITWRLLAVTMPLSILLITLLGCGLLGLPLASAVLLGALLAPTDPVLASDIQVGPPGSENEDEVRFSLTSEAGLNDGLAFPFINLALAMALADSPGWAWTWLGVDVVWKIAAGIFMGWAIGYGLGLLTFRLPNRAKLSRTGDGFVVLGMTAIAYGVTEMAHGYGFLAVFVAALALRKVERSHAYHEKLHGFAEQIERLLMMLLLVLFGGAIAGGLLAPLTWEAAALGLLVLCVVRPLTGVIGLLGTKAPREERLVISLFGIRGIGSFYYLSHALNQAPFEGADLLWAITGFIVLASIVGHGISVTPTMRWLDRPR
ncbi:MAG: cation:proton antiporter [Alphaproteobacteria bacterium]|nr:cation:proton antiporter [Alphaproteobacteria bacterium]